MQLLFNDKQINIPMPIAKMIKFANKVSGRSSTNVQDVIDEIDADVSDLKNTKIKKGVMTVTSNSAGIYNSDLKYSDMIILRAFASLERMSVDRREVDAGIFTWDDGKYFFRMTDYGANVKANETLRFEYYYIDNIFK